MPAPVLIAPSLLAADYARLAEELHAVETAGADWLHLDVMDGHFVPNISFGADVIAALRPHTDLPFDVHLMIAPVDPHIPAFARAGAARLTVHAEAGPHLDRTLQTVRAEKMAAGVALNPATPASVIAHVLDRIDLVCVMTVNPGFGGQSFLDSQLEKIREIRALVERRPIRIEVDGGITPETAGKAVAAGADVLVAGSSVFGAADRGLAIAALRRAAGGPGVDGSSISGSGD